MPRSGSDFLVRTAWDVGAAMDNTSENGKTIAARLSDRRNLRREKDNRNTHWYVLCKSESLFYSIAFGLCNCRHANADFTSPPFCLSPSLRICTLLIACAPIRGKIFGTLAPRP